MSVRRKQRLLFVFGVFFLGSVLLMFLRLSSQNFDDDFVEDVSDFKVRLMKEIELELNHQRETNNEVLLVLERFPDEDRVYANGRLCPRQQPTSLGKSKIEVIQSNGNESASLQQFGNSETCPVLPQDVADSDIDMTDVYDKLLFDNLDGGVWKQGFTIKTSDAEWNGKKLKVFVVPHSHNDPGWRRTVKEYFEGSTQHILNNIVDALYKDPKRRFIWAEMSYLSMWWRIADPDRKNKMKKLVHNGQLEMVTAGWVMNDEANTHYFAMIDQMIEGNEWLAHNLGIVPKNGWAIDPFGHSSTMAYILKKMKFKNMLIQRVHYAVKKHLGLQKAFEFKWRQSWSSDQFTDIFCHMIPFPGYDVSNSCGPDPAVCCQYDFARLLNYFKPCQHVGFGRPEAITKENVASKAKKLIDQYRKKSKLFRTNSLLIPLGDDFRYVVMDETMAQFKNYEMIFQYVNSHPELHTEIQFGTLSEYFQAMQNEMGSTNKKLPVLTGDFFTYADRNDDYWSGYYVSRPYHKMQDRILESHLRGAEILFSLALANLKSPSLRKSFVKETYGLLVEARRNLGVFQHHDGITGTAKKYVVVDYGQMLMKSIMDSKKIQMLSAQALFDAGSGSSFNPSHMMFDFDEVYHTQNQLPERRVIQLHSEEQEATVVVFNSLPYERTGVISFLVSTPSVVVSSLNSDSIPSQTNLVWIDGITTETNKFEVLFSATLPALGMATYTFTKTANSKRNKLSKTVFYNFLVKPAEISHKSPFQVTTDKTRKYIELENDYIKAKFSPFSGSLQYLVNKISGASTKLSINFVKYSTQWSGAYLFLPRGPAKQLVNPDFRPLIRVITGPIKSEIHVQLPHLLHKVMLYQSSGEGVQPLGVHVHNSVDVRNYFDNREIAMRITSDVHSRDKFFTDLNGFQIQERTTYSKLPLQGNFYPMPSMAFIQDSRKRLSLLTGQPLGVSSLKEGQLEVIMDRRLMQNDYRGLGEGVTDNVVTPESFVILLEHWNYEDSKKTIESLSYPSLTAHRLSWELLHPMRSMNLKLDGQAVLLNKISPLQGRAWPCDLHLLNLRSIQDENKEEPNGQIALLLHRVGYECTSNLDRCLMANCEKTAFNRSSKISLNSLLPIREVKKTSLSLQKESRRLYTNTTFTVSSMEIEAFKIKL